MGHFLAYLGIGGCNAGEEDLPALVPSANVTTTSKAQETSASRASVTPLPKDQGAKTGLNSQGKIGIGVGVALAFLIALAVIGRQYLQYRNRKLDDSAKNHAMPTESTQAFFQQKGELEAEERREYELHHEECRYELEENEIREMPVTEGINMTALQRPELRGDDHVKELASSPS
ncbi:MAG: hypothetical protein HETSPECPRED_003658 [Heterodermia speciosa]|uniref:Uncharacterized protein n=1 Tax=Heterodermia speciosa TaxID=116794 RepID=A0A8H3F9Q4_9LECA|nr:MAG: hypothetical protein HETSPECPRED_003658 [Heterodermia speciosa]